MKRFWHSCGFEFFPFYFESIIPHVSCVTLLKVFVCFPTCLTVYPALRSCSCVPFVCCQFVFVLMSSVPSWTMRFPLLKLLCFGLSVLVTGLWILAYSPWFFFYFWTVYLVGPLPAFTFSFSQCILYFLIKTIELNLFCLLSLPLGPLPCFSVSTPELTVTFSREYKTIC